MPRGGAAWIRKLVWGVMLKHLPLRTHESTHSLVPALVPSLEEVPAIGFKVAFPDVVRVLPSFSTVVASYGLEGGCMHLSQGGGESSLLPHLAANVVVLSGLVRRDV